MVLICKVQVTIKKPLWERHLAAIKSLMNNAAIGPFGPFNNHSIRCEIPVHKAGRSGFETTSKGL
jgi:hypothetical protein